jgi:hypothetical protein
MKTTSGHETEQLDVADDDHPLSDMDSRRQAPIEVVAKNVVNRYDERKKAIREFLANAVTACIQRAKHMIRDNGIDDCVDMSNVHDVLDVARDEFEYNPVVEVAYNNNPQSGWTLRIADNGIGISSTTAYAIRDVGLSGWHSDGTTNGQFGQGTFSGFLLCGKYGLFTCTTHSAITGENYRTEWKLTDLNRLNGGRDRIGTTFEWPVFCDEAQDIDIYEAVREYAAGFPIDITYEEYDENGNQCRTDEFTPYKMEDRYPDDALVITYEDTFGKVVWSPDDPDGWNDTISTYCGYQPIDRNERVYGMNSYEMPSSFDFRLKDESGPIIEVGGSMDHELVGKTPVSRQQYQALCISERGVVPESFPDDDNIGWCDPESGEMFVTDDVRASQRSDLTLLNGQETDALERVVISGEHEGKPVVTSDEWKSMDDGRTADDYVPRDELPDTKDVLVAMEPTDDRDRFERKNVRPVLERYSEKLWNELRARTATVFADIDTFQDVFELEGNESALFFDGVSRFGPSYTNPDATTVQQELEDELNVTLPVDVCEKISVMRKTVSWAPRDSRRPERKGNRRKKPVWKIIRKAQDGDKDGDVYMGFRVNPAKAQLVWELNEHNQVIQTTKRDMFEDALGWERMTDLPTTDWEREFDHDFDQSFLDEWESDATTSSSSRSPVQSLIQQMELGDERAKKRNVKVRSGTGTGHIASVHGERLFEQCDGQRDDVQFRGTTINTCICYRETEHSASVGKRFADRDRGVFYTVVPNYVYEYLIMADNCVTEQEYIDSLLETSFEHDWSDDGTDSRTLADATKRDVLLYVGRESVDAFKEHDAFGALKDEIESTLRDDGVLDAGESVRSISVIEKSSKYYLVCHENGPYISDTERPTFVTTRMRTLLGYDPSYIEMSETFYDAVLPELDRDAPEWEAFSPDPTNDERIKTLKRLQDAGGFVSTDDDGVSVPDNDCTALDDVLGIDIRRKHVVIVETLQRLEDAGGFVETDDGSDVDAQ